MLLVGSYNWSKGISGKREPHLFGRRTIRLLGVSDLGGKVRSLLGEVIPET